MDTPCIEWTGSCQPDGYGRAYVKRAGRWTTTSAHRAAYERAYGALPSTLQVDHLCRNKLCVNLAHLEAVTRQENDRRRRRTKATCKRGHSLRDPTNLYWQPPRKNGYRAVECRTCRRDRGLERLSQPPIEYRRPRRPPRSSCRAGHAFTEANSGWRHHRDGHWYVACRTCVRLAQRQRRATGQR